jgi:hypothetical protein
MLVTLAMSLGLVACSDNSGPAEDLGRQIDDAVEEARDRAEDVADEAREAADEISDAVQGE